MEGGLSRATRIQVVSSTTGQVTPFGQVIQASQSISGIASNLTIVSHPGLFSDPSVLTSSSLLTYLVALPIFLLRLRKPPEMLRCVKDESKWTHLELKRLWAASPTDSDATRFLAPSFNDSDERGVS